MPLTKPLLLILLIYTSFFAQAQDSTRLDRLLSLPDKLFASMDKKSRGVEEKLSRQTDKYLNRLEKQENRLKKKLLKKDSVLAKELFADLEAKYTRLKQAPQHVGKYSGVYSGHLDSLATALNFLKSNQATAVPALTQSLGGLTSLQDKLNHTEQIKKYLVERQRFLKEQFGRVGMVKELRQYQKQVYYYRTQVEEYKKLWEDPSKLEEKLMEVLVNVPAFKDFFAQNSQLGSLFALPGANGSSTASLQGLQTRASVQQIMQDRFGTGPNVTQALRGNVQAAQGQVAGLKNKAAQFTSGQFGNSDSDIEQPDFRPNEQKTKSFLQRLELGTNVQSQKASYFFPVTSDLGLSLGYKLNDKSVVGVGASYKLGLGSGWQNVELSHQGVGLRSFVDYKLKGSIYISGGYEQNYRSEIHSVAQLKDYSSWQVSGLIGLAKKYKVAKKLKGEMKLLWDFLSYQQVPRTQAVLFRVGYSLK